MSGAGAEGEFYFQTLLPTHSSHYGTNSPVQTTAWFAALSVNEDPRRDMLAFLERMKDQGGSLFRDGLVIPEGPEEVESGEMDEDSDLEIIT